MPREYDQHPAEDKAYVERSKSSALAVVCLFGFVALVIALAPWVGIVIFWLHEKFFPGLFGLCIQYYDWVFSLGPR